jgi:hypothetical protein
LKEVTMGDLKVFYGSSNPGEVKVEVRITLPAKLEEYFRSMLATQVEVDDKKFVPAERAV